MKKILLSTRPKWCEKICHEIGTDKNGKPIYEKEIEVRKTKPSIPTPFKVYIYCTRQKINGEILLTYDKKVEGRNRGFREKGDIPLAGKVIGEFVCYWISEYESNFSSACDGEIREVFYDPDDNERIAPIIAEVGDKCGLMWRACMSWKELRSYMGDAPKTFYAWHISQLKIYDIPKTLGEFRTPPCEKSEKACGKCKYLVKIDTPDMYEVDCFVANGREITRPPQSWCYVQELEERK